jgi:UDP-glucuronate 4-epimerase
MKILITGTAGFIGFHLVKKLIVKGNIITGIDNINDYYDVQLKFSRLAQSGIGSIAVQWYQPVKSTLYPNYTFIRMNLEDQQELNHLFENENFDVVCHLAAQAGVRYSIDHPEKYISSNITGFFNVLEACRNYKVKHLVYASSSSVYGNQQKMPLSVDDVTDHPVSLYAATKKSNELMAYTYSHLYNLNTTGLRFFTVYGPWGRPDMAPVLFANAINSGTPIKVFNHGNLERDFTYIDDIIEGIDRVIHNQPAPDKKSSTNFPLLPTGKVPDQREDGVVTSAIVGRMKGASLYNIGNGTPVKLMDFISTIEKAIGKEAQKEFLPMQPGDVLKTFADVSALKNDFGYAPNTTLDHGIREFIHWFQSYYKKD